MDERLARILAKAASYVHFQNDTHRRNNPSVQETSEEREARVQAHINRVAATCAIHDDKDCNCQPSPLE